MPIITISTCGLLSGRVKELLSSEVIEITEKCLNKKANLIVIKFVSNNDYYSSEAVSDGINVIDVEIKITKGTNELSQKEFWISEIWKVMSSHLVLDKDAPNYISINEMDSNGWGYNGVTQYKRSVTVN